MFIFSPHLLNFLPLLLFLLPLTGLYFLCRGGQ
jgi:hypothetical protein